MASLPQDDQIRWGGKLVTWRRPWQNLYIPGSDSFARGTLGAARPGAAYSALVGAVASATLPGPLRGLAYRAFARAVGANLAETELDLREYRSLGDFFTRKLRHGARTIDPAPDAIVSPC